jgi:hypothetical protein
VQVLERGAGYMNDEADIEEDILDEETDLSWPYTTYFEYDNEDG